MFDFPNGPTVGQNTTAPNGAVFVWDGAKWTTAANAATIGEGGPFLPLSGGTVTGPTTFVGGTNADRAFLFAHHNVNPAAATSGQQANWYAFNVDNDSADTTSAIGGGAHAAYFGSNISTGAKGGRTGFTVFQAQAGATTLSVGQYYVALGAFNEAYHSAGGVPGAPQGALFASNVGATIKTGAGYWLTCVGTEIDVGVEAGNTVQFKSGLSIVQFANDAVQASLDDAAIQISNQYNGTAPGWKVGIEFGGYTGWWPFTNTSILIGTKPAANPGGPPMQAGTGLDLAAVTFSGNAIQTPNFHIANGGHVFAGAGIDFGVQLSAGHGDFSKHIDLYNGQFGINISSDGATNYVASAAHQWWMGGVNIGYMNSTGLNMMPIGQQTAVAGSFTTLSASGTVSGAGFTTLLTPYAPLASPAFTGTPSLPTGTTGITQTAGTSNTTLATTAFVAAAAGGGYTLPTASTTVLGGVKIDGTTVTIAAGVITAALPVASSTLPVVDGTATIGVGTTWARADHIHPVDTSRYAAANPSGYQTAANVTTALAAGQPGAFSTLSASSTVSGTGFSTYLASPPAIGGTAPSTGKFTTVQSTIATGTAPLIVASTTNVANLNASSLNGATFAAPGAIGGTTAAAGAFTTLSATSTTTLAAMTSTGITASPISGSTGSFTTLGATGAATLSGGGTFTGTYAGTHTYSGAVTFSSAFSAAGGAMTGGLSFGATVAPGGATDLSRHIELYGGGYAGFNVTSGQLNYVVASGAAHVFYVGASTVGFLGSTGLNTMNIGQTTPAIGAFSAVQVGSVSGPTIRSGTGAATGTQPNGSLWLRTDGTSGARLYVSAGAGTWTAVATV